MLVFKKNNLENIHFVSFLIIMCFVRTGMQWRILPRTLRQDKYYYFRKWMNEVIEKRSKIYKHKGIQQFTSSSISQ